MEIKTLKRKFVKQPKLSKVNRVNLKLDGTYSVQTLTTKLPTLVATGRET